MKGGVLVAEVVALTSTFTFFYEVSEMVVTYDGCMLQRRGISAANELLSRILNFCRKTTKRKDIESILVFFFLTDGESTRNGCSDTAVKFFIWNKANLSRTKIFVHSSRVAQHAFKC